MDATTTSRPGRNLVSAAPRLAIAADERQSPWVVDIGTGRVVRRKPSPEAEEATVG